MHTTALLQEDYAGLFTGLLSITDTLDDRYLAASIRVQNK
jgi:hypothetical protein